MYITNTYIFFSTCYVYQYCTTVMHYTVKREFLNQLSYTMFTVSITESHMQKLIFACIILKIQCPIITYINVCSILMKYKCLKFHNFKTYLNYALLIFKTLTFTRSSGTHIKHNKCEFTYVYNIVHSINNNLN